MAVTRARLDERGRLVLPVEVRHRLGLRPGDEMIIVDQADGTAQLKSRQSAARELIGLAGGPLDHSAVEELRDQREREAASEDEAAGQHR